MSDIHFDLRPECAAADLDRYIDVFVFSFEHGFKKPDARMFQVALDHFDVAPAAALMVGDHSRRDGGAASVGITTLILSPLRALLDWGLRSVLDLCGLGTSANPATVHRRYPASSDGRTGEDGAN